MKEKKPVWFKPEIHEKIKEFSESKIMSMREYIEILINNDKEFQKYFENKGEINIFDEVDI